MNDILRIKGQFGHNTRKSQVGMPSLPANGTVKSEQIGQMILQLQYLQVYWSDKKINDNALISIEYNRVVAKSNRVRRLIASNTTKTRIVGAKFNKGESYIHHIITYYAPYDSIQESIYELITVKSIVDKQFNGSVNKSIVDKINKKEIRLNSNAISRTSFVNLIVDSFYVEKIFVPTPESTEADTQIVTLYDTKEDYRKWLTVLGIEIELKNIIDKNTFILDKAKYEILVNKVPYLVSMAVKDFAKYEPIESNELPSHEVFTLPPPTNEPIIGVIDSFFDDSVYFSEWVDVCDELKGIPVDNKDREHGTAVDSIIVDGHRINPTFNDGCGNFRVRHFSLITSNGYNSIEIMKKVRKIVTQNRDIKVWNFSIGSALEINENFISYQAFELDKLQNEYDDIIFVVAGTNDNSHSMKKRIGAPADSINSIVVNSIKRGGEPAAYSRKGPVLSFYNKPDIAYYGGDKNEPIRVCTRNGAISTCGTSFAAPFIARKIAFLIHRVGLSREIAKALIVDSAIGWKPNRINNIHSYIGMGVVPIRIEDILHSNDDEIRFVITSEASTYDNYLYRIPVPISNNMQPYIAKATLCYFSECERNQGVDYTSTELDIHFGRITNKGIKTINDNCQNTPDSRIIEASARNYYRKWDNIKVICERQKDRGKAKSLYENGFWGISIKKTERNSKHSPNLVKFGLVITLKNIYGENLINEFIQKCAINELLVSSINVEERVRINTKIEEDIELED